MYSKDAIFYSVARINRRNYWVTWRYQVDDEDWNPVIIADGFAETPEEAKDLSQSAAKDAGTCSLGQFMPTEGFLPCGVARAIYRKCRARKTTAKDTRAQMTEFLWQLFEPEESGQPCYWIPHRIMRKTKLKVFVEQCGFSVDKGEPWNDSGKTYALDRATLERDGSVSAQNKRYLAFYNEDGKKTYEAEHWRSFQKTDPERGWNYGFSAFNHAVPHCAQILGLTAPFAKADVLRAFREAAHQHHPDKGGDADQFRAIVEAKDAALQLANP
jgi:hypothetical protein